MEKHTAPPPFRRQCTALLALYAFFFQHCATPLLWGNPNGGTVKAGTATITPGRGTLTIDQSSQRAIIEWGDFSIGSGETTTFNLANGGGATLNRVTGALTSQIAGQLNSNGQLFLVNPNGIVVAGTAVINTASFIGSTRDIADGNFMFGAPFRFDGTSTAGVTVQGGAQITASSGDVILIGQTVSNSGTLNAPNGVAGLAAGKEIVYTPLGFDKIRVVSGQGTDGGVGTQNTGTIQAAQAELKAAGGNVYSLAVNARGSITATSVATRNGRIVLTSAGGTVAVGGTHKTSGRGNMITTTGTQSSTAKVIVEKGATLESSNIDLATTKSTRSYGTLKAAGGQVTVASKSVDFRGNVNAGTLTVRSLDNLKVATLGAPPDEPLFTDPATPSQVDTAMLAGAGAQAKQIDLESTKGNLTVADRFGLKAFGGPKLRLAAATNLNINADTFTSNEETLVAGNSVNLAAPVRNLGVGSDVFIKSGSGAVNISGRGLVQASGGQIVVAGGGGFSNTASARALALQPGTGGRWIIFSPSAGQTNLGGLAATTTVYNAGQPGSLADVSRSLGGGANAVAYPFSDPAFQTANLTTGGFIDEVVANGAPQPPALDPATSNPTIIPPPDYERSPTFHSDSLVPPNETADQRAARLANEAVILQLLGLPADPDLFPMIYDLVRSMFEEPIPPGAIAAFFASLATNQDARFLLAGLMTSHVIDLLGKSPLTAAEQKLLDHLAANILPNLQQKAAQAALDNYEAFKAGGTGIPLAFSHLLQPPGEGYEAPSTLLLLAGSKPDQLSVAQGWGIAVGTGLAGGTALAAIPGALAATKVINLATKLAEAGVNIGEDIVEAGVAGGEAAAEAATEAITEGSVEAGVELGTETITEAASAGASAASGPLIVITAAIICLVTQSIKVGKITKMEKALHDAVKNAAKGFNWSDYLGSDEGKAMLAQMLNYQFAVSTADYAATISARATGTTNLPVVTH